MRRKSASSVASTPAKKGHIYGYARVSTIDQHLTLQVEALKAAGCTNIRSEKKSGSSTSGRDELQTLIDFVRPGDTIVVTRVDRLARSIADLSQIVRTLQEKGVALRATEQPIDTGSPEGRAFLQMLGVFAEFETAIRRERQLEGIRKAMAEGRYLGRPISVDAARIRDLASQGHTARAIVEALGVGRASVYRALKTSRAAAVARVVADQN